MTADALHSPVPLSVAEIQHGLNTHVVGRHIVLYDQVTSTNDLALGAVGSTSVSSDEGLVILAESQTAGRGRIGRKWIAPEGTNVLMSVLLFPSPEIDRAEVLVMWSAVAVAETLSTWTAEPITVKWPNDVLLAGQKVAGILVERGNGTVMGVGINVHASPPPEETPDGLPATCLAEHFRPDRRGVSRSVLVRELLQRLDDMYALLARGEVSVLRERWEARLAYLGHPVEVTAEERKFDGVLRSLDPTGMLVLETADGCLEIPSICLRQIRPGNFRGT